MVEKRPEDVYNYEMANKNRGNCVGACIKALREEENSDSFKKAILVELLHRLYNSSEQMEELVREALTADAEEHGDLITNLFSKGEQK